MSKCSYADEGRTQLIDNNEVVRDLEGFRAEGHVCYCPNPNCHAHMSPARHEDGITWKALPSSPHDPECVYSSNLCAGVNPLKYDYRTFRINEFLANLENPVHANAPAQHTQNGNGAAQEHQENWPTTLYQVYAICKTLTPGEWLQGRLVRNAIIDNRTIDYHMEHGIHSSYIGELKFYQFFRISENNRILAGVLGAGDRKLTVSLEFEDDKLFDSVLDRIFQKQRKDNTDEHQPGRNTAHRNKAIIVAGRWRKSEEGPAQYTIRIRHRRQIHIFKFSDDE